MAMQKWIGTTWLNVWQWFGMPVSIAGMNMTLHQMNANDVRRMNGATGMSA